MDSIFSFANVVAGPCVMVRTEICRKNDLKCVGRGIYVNSSYANLESFYRSMHYSAKRGLAITCRPSVCLSVRDVGGSGSHSCWQSWKLIARTISTTPMLFVAQTASTYSQGNMGTFYGD